MQAAAGNLTFSGRFLVYWLVEYRYSMILSWMQEAHVDSEGDS